MNQQVTNSKAPVFKLIVRQQPSKARLCSFKEKVDRRPIDPPPIIQLQSSNQTDDEYLQNPYFFLYATLTDVRGETDLHFVNGNRTTAGTVVQSLHKLKGFDNTDGGFFIFSDISVRLEGFYRLKFTLYEIERSYVSRICSIVSDIFQVYSPKSFPGMSESTFLTRTFSDQGVRIRIRKEPRSSNSNPNGKRRRKNEDHATESDDDEHSSQSHSHSSAIDRPIPHNISSMPLKTPPIPQQPYPQQSYPQQSYPQQSYPQQPHLQQSYPQQSLPYPPSAYFSRSPSPQYLDQRYDHTQKCFEITKPTLPSPKEIFRSSPMSMQNILSADNDPSKHSGVFPPSSLDDQHNRIFTTRILPLPLPSQSHPPTSSVATSPEHHSKQHLSNSPSWRGQILPPPSTLSSPSLFQPMPSLSRKKP